MAKTLELIFGTNMGRQATITVNNPKEPVDEAAVKEAMEQIVAVNVFQTASGEFTEMKGARLVDRTVTEFELS